MLVPEITCNWLVVERDDELVTPETPDEIRHSFCVIQDLYTRCYGKCMEYVKVPEKD